MARYAVISDIHGNIYAFQAVLAAMSGLEVDGLICLGDVVGYGPHPGECLDLVVRHCTDVVQGNHDLAVVDPVCASRFNGAAREAVFWTKRNVSPLHLDALVRLKAVAELDYATTGDGRVLCVHDCPAPGPTSYVHDRQVAAHAFTGVESGVCLVGHTHVPMVFETSTPHGAALDLHDVTGYIPRHDEPIVLDPNARYICNPGSVGQPRDCDPRASYAVLDGDAGTFTVHRVEYDIAAAQAATQQAGLPTVLAARLAVGA